MCMYECGSCLYGRLLNYGSPTIVRTTATTSSNSVTTFTATAPSVPVVDFILELDQQFPYSTDTTVLTEGTVTYPLVSRNGSDITIDQLFLAIILRKMGLMRSYGCNPYRFRAQTRNNPSRVALIDCLPPSQLVTTTTADASSNT